LGLAAFAVVGSLVSLKRHSMWTNNPPVPYGIGGFFIPCMIFFIYMLY
jgi:hypothetical protein